MGENYTFYNAIGAATRVKQYAVNLAFAKDSDKH